MKRFTKFKTRVVILTSAFISIFAGATYAEDAFETFPMVFHLTDINGNNGFTMQSSRSISGLGYSVSKVGDINGDGIDDISIGTEYGDAYVVFGSENPWAAVVDFSKLNGSNGFRIDPSMGWDCAVSGAGDLNGDGIHDILVGLFDANNAGQTCVVFGSKEPWPAVIDCSKLDGSNGFVLDGIHPDDRSGYSISGAGDVNGDGIDDILIGAYRANNYKGQSYVIFGNKELWPAVIDLFSLNGVNGFTIAGINAGDDSGYSVSGAGDINEDGIADILIGADLANDKIGQSYVVFGKKNPWFAHFNLSSLNGGNGFTINGVKPNDRSGSAVSGAGDVNGDGIPDILIGAPGANNKIGQSYIVFGSKESWPAVINLANLDGSNGFTMNGRAPGSSGSAVSSAGDINGDDIDDILIGAPSVGSNAGQSYVIFGSKEPWPAVINFASLDGANGFFINGIKSSDLSGCSVSGAGDVNGDGIDDILIGSRGAKQGYIIFGEHK